MEGIDFKYLAEKYINGNISHDEERLLSEYYDASQETQIPWNQNKMGVQDDVKIILYNKVLKEIAKREKHDKKGKLSHVFFDWRIAAALITIVSTITYFYIKEPYTQVVKNNKPKPAQNDILPGGNKATLTLANGSQIILDNTNIGTITTQGNIAINKSKNGQLIYQVEAGNQLSNDEKPVYNIIKTPFGGQYQVILSDNTKVWLNAGSSIKFPTVFTNTERYVEVEGEAYFEVSKDKKRPFKVSTDKQLIEVLGTHFNINAYKDEAQVKTTLLEGSVKISSGTLSNMIKPGEQARLSGETGKMDIVKVDTEESISWKNGYFLFENEDIHSVMRKISRWYGIEVVYLNDEINEKFGGAVSKFENVSQVLKILEVTGTIHFKIEGRRIIVMQ